jgi:23S rRNA (cytidine2498-2'-O)-methyltransferase
LIPPLQRQPETPTENPAEKQTTVEASYLFATCQPGVEPVLKQEVGAVLPESTLAFSRPGFVTFKLPPTQASQAGAHPIPSMIFPRRAGLSIGRADGESIEALAKSVADSAERINAVAIHVWGRAEDLPRLRDADRERIAEAASAADAIRNVVGTGDVRTGDVGRGMVVRTPDSEVPPELESAGTVLDCCVVDPGQWWLGTHDAAAMAPNWAGGYQRRELPPEAVSRGWLKIQEALAWSCMSMAAEETVLEIGCAPGGASQYLLSKGLFVIGVDPAEMDPVVAEHPRFQHVRRRSRAVSDKLARQADWLVLDVNLPPRFAVDVIAGVWKAQPRIKGALLTLKLRDWSLAANLPVFLDDLCEATGRNATGRHLFYNHQEICVAIE